MLRVGPDLLTELAVHLLDLESIQHYIIVGLIPACESGKRRAWKRGDWRQPKTIKPATNHVARADDCHHSDWVGEHDG